MRFDGVNTSEGCEYHKWCNPSFHNWKQHRSGGLKLGKVNINDFRILCKVFEVISFPERKPPGGIIG